MSKGFSRSLRRGAPAQSPISRSRILLSAVAITVANGSSAPGIGTAVVGDLPEGNILVLGAVAYIKFDATGDTDATATWNGDYSVGSAPNADADLTDAADFDLIASTAVGPAVARVSPVTRGVNAAQSMLDNTDGSLEVNLNLMIDDADQSGAVSVLATGYIDIAFIVLSDD